MHQTSLCLVTRVSALVIGADLMVAFSPAQAPFRRERVRPCMSRYAFDLDPLYRWVVLPLGITSSTASVDLRREGIHVRSDCWRPAGR